MVICMTRYQLYELRDNYISMDTLNPEQSNENVQVHATTQEQWKCDRCPATFRNKALLARHKSQLHRPVKKYNCCHCGEGFNSAANFAIHRAVHNQKLFKCPRCALVFRRHATLVGHIELHYVGEENICAVCDREFQSLDELKAHIYEGHEKNMKKPAQPKINIIRKSGKETFQCTLCDNKVFPKRSALERHFLTHTKQKPFVCDTCGKSFNQKCSLKMHTLVHSKIQKHVCALCGLKFSQKANLRVHTFRVHPKRTPSLADRLPCPYCPSLFKNLGSLNGHKTRVHASMQSEHAKKNETTKTEDAPPAHRLDTDQIIQNTGQGIVYKCGTCEGDFYDLPQLRRHMETHVPSTNRHDESTSKPPIVETVKLETSDPSALYQYVNESSNDVSTASTEDNALSDHANITEGNVQRVPIKDIKWRPKSRSIIIPDKTAEELFSEVTEDGQKKYVCTGCNKGFKQSVDLRRHIRTHTGHSASIDDITLNDHANSTEGHRRNVSMQNKAWQGQPKSTSSKLLNKTEEELFSHVLEDGRKKYVCTGCNRVFRKPIDLRRHIRTHTGERPFKCDKCERAFVLKGVLDVHKKTHDALREKMSCSEPGCTSQFTSKAGLKLHLRIHTGDRPFECTICDLTFRTSGHLQAHMTAHLRIVAKKRQRYETWAFGK